jgi:hypothetical protein
MSGAFHPYRCVRSGVVAVEHPSVLDPDGRLVVFDAGSHLHLARRRPWLRDHLDVIMNAVSEARAPG